MKNISKILILNTGGTFNKIYDPVKGELIVPKNNSIINEIANKTKIELSIEGLIFKDSLQMDENDRLKIFNYLKDCKYKKIIIIHGTDTMNLTAQFLHDKLKDKQIVLTGAMIPYSIDGIEATSNLMTAYGFLLSNKKGGVFISMHGFVKKHNKIKKNKNLGVFECQK